MSNMKKSYGDRDKKNHYLQNNVVRQDEIIKKARGGTLFEKNNSHLTASKLSYVCEQSYRAEYYFDYNVVSDDWALALGVSDAFGFGENRAKFLKLEKNKQTIDFSVLFSPTSPGEHIFELKFVNLTRRITHWLVNETLTVISKLKLTGVVVTPFPTTMSLAASSEVNFRFTNQSDRPANDLKVAVSIKKIETTTG